MTSLFHIDSRPRPLTHRLVTQHIALGLFSLGLVACGGTRENDAAVLSQGSLDLAIQQLTDATIVTAAAGMAAEVEALSGYIPGFCAAPDATGLSQLQSQWQSTALAWHRLLPYNFGPLNDDLIFPPYQFIDSYRPRGRDYTETVRTNVDGWLASDDALNSDAFTSLSFNQVGLLALEVVLFETATDQSSDAAEIVNEFTEQPRKCDVLAGLASALEQHTDGVRDGWSLTYQDTGSPYRDLFLASELEDGSTPLVTLLTTAQEYLDYLQQRDAVSNVAQLSANGQFDSWALMSASIDSINDLLAGVADEQVSIFELMISSGNAAAVATVQANIQQARDAITSLDSTSFNATAAALDGNFKREIPDSLDVSLGINFSDGD